MQALDVCDWEPLHVYLHSQCGKRVGGGRNLMEVGIRGIKGQSLFVVKDEKQLYQGRDVRSWGRVRAWGGGYTFPVFE